MSYPAEPQGNPLTRQLGPLPLWAWGGLGVLGAILIYMYNKNKSNQANNTASNTPGGVDSSLVPQFVNQTYVENIPPAAPNMTVKDKEPDHDADDKVRGKPKPILPGQPGQFNPHQHYETITVTKTGWASTLAGIAKQERVPGGAAAVAKLNHLPSGAHLHVGQKLKVPVEKGEPGEKGVLWPSAISGR